MSPPDGAKTTTFQRRHTSELWRDATAARLTRRPSDDAIEANGSYPEIGSEIFLRYPADETGPFPRQLPIQLFGGTHQQVAFAAHLHLG
jgi:hypothetical protein